jgi:hypothetical protein
MKIWPRRVIRETDDVGIVKKGPTSTILTWGSGQASELQTEEILPHLIGKKVRILMPR